MPWKDGSGRLKQLCAIPAQLISEAGAPQPQVPRWEGPEAESEEAAEGGGEMAARRWERMPAPCRDGGTDTAEEAGTQELPQIQDWTQGPVTAAIPSLHLLWLWVTPSRVGWGERSRRRATGGTWVGGWPVAAAGMAGCCDRQKDTRSAGAGTEEGQEAQPPGGGCPHFAQLSLDK